MRPWRFFSEGRYLPPLIVVMMLVCAGLLVAELRGPRHDLVIKDGWPPEAKIAPAR